MQQRGVLSISSNTCGGGGVAVENYKTPVSERSTKSTWDVLYVAAILEFLQSFVTEILYCCRWWILTHEPANGAKLSSKKMIGEADRTVMHV